LGYLRAATEFHIRERDLSAFLTYASRELNLDASQRAANPYLRADEHRRAIDALRDLKETTFRNRHTSEHREHPI
jgi:hypothetical protein